MTALPGSGSFAMVDPTHVAAVGPAAAILFARIVWRSGATGEWPATRRMLQQETGLSEPMLRTAVQVLREREWVSTRRVSSEDATLVWTPIHAGQADMTESATPPLRNPSHPPAESAISSSKTVETLLGDPAPEAPAKRPRKATGYPEGFRPKEAHLTLAASLGVDLRVEGPQFQDHHTAKGSTFKDWDAALRTWIRNAAKFRGGGNVIPIQDSGTVWGAGTEPMLPPPPKRDLYG